jgi:hypothetical protein
MDEPVVNRSIVVLMLLVALTGSGFAGDPTPAPRSARPKTTNAAKPTASSAVRSGTRTVSSRNGNVVGAGVRREAAPAKATSVPPAAVTTGSAVVKASSQVVGEEIIYEDGGYAPTAGEYVVEDGGMLPSASSCSTCGTGGCDGACGASCGADTSGWGSCGFDLCSPGPGKRRQLCICLPSHGWVQMDYLMWWQAGMNVPPLLSSSTAGTAQANAGVLGLSSTSLLLGDEDLVDDRLNGGRLRFGWWFANCPTVGIEGEYLGFNTLEQNQEVQSTGNPILARPFFNIAPDTGFAREDSELIALPNVVSGSFTTQATSTIDGAAVRLRRMLCCGNDCSYAPLHCGPISTQSRIDATIGWRFFQLREGLTMTEDLESLRPQEPGSFLIQDNFRTRNQFNGVELGFLRSHRAGYWSLDTILRVSLGTTRQEVAIDGSTAITQNGNTVNHQVGFLTQRTNSGTFTRDQFGVVPELGLTVGYQLTQHWRATLGYTFIYWSNVVRPGDHIDRDVNPNLLPPETTPFVGAERPRFSFRETDYWLQGGNVGLEYRW